MRKKYNNTPIEADGYKFDSKEEYTRFKELELLKKTGEVVEIEVHPTFILQKAFRKCTKCNNIQNHKERSSKVEDTACTACGCKTEYFAPIKYIADFRVLYADGHDEIEDVKGSIGVMTDVFLMKKKMFALQFPDLTLKVVIRRDRWKKSADL